MASLSANSTGWGWKNGAAHTDWQVHQTYFISETFLWDFQVGQQRDVQYFLCYCTAVGRPPRVILGQHIA
jgi:hypothetical protein